MKKKIREYVYYQLRFDNDAGNEELKEEIISNISDRYDEIFEKTNDSNYAYISAIKSMGDFAEDKNIEKEKVAYKPSIPEMFLIAGVILAIFGVLIVLFSSVAGAIVIMISIVAFSVGANYIYQESQYIKEVEYDIEKHNDYLTKIFSYVKTCFVFWAIGISYLVAAVINSVISSIMLVETVGSLGMDEFTTVIIISFVLFILIFITLLSIFKKIHDKLIARYYELTGESKLDSKLETAKSFMGIKSNRTDATGKKYIFNKTWFYPSIVGLSTIIFLITPVYVHVKGVSINYENGILLGVLGLIGINSTLTAIIMILMIPIVIVIVLLALRLFNKINSRFVVPIAYIALSIIHIIIASTTIGDVYVCPTSAQIGFLSSVLLIIIIINDLILNSLKK